MREWNLRELKSKDIFPICGILKKIGIKELKGIIGGNELLDVADAKKVNIEAMAIDTLIDLVGVVVSNLPSCEKELYAFLESIIIPDEGEKIDRKVLEELPLNDFIDLVKQVVTKKEFKDFFSVAINSSN